MVIATPTDREVEVLRLLHGGCRVVATAKGAGRLELPGAETVRPATLQQMVDAGWLAFDGVKQRWTLTELGKDQVRVRDDVQRFITDGAA